MHTVLRHLDRVRCDGSLWGCDKPFFADQVRHLHAQGCVEVLLPALEVVLFSFTDLAGRTCSYQTSSCFMTRTFEGLCTALPQDMRQTQHAIEYVAVSAIHGGLMMCQEDSQVQLTRHVEMFKGLEMI